MVCVYCSAPQTQSNYNPKSIVQSVFQCMGPVQVQIPASKLWVHSDAMENEEPEVEY